MTYAVITSSGPVGYHCIDRSPDLRESSVRELERNALPFGGKWASYGNARAIKGFPLEDKMALCYSRVTDMRDDYGRRGVLLGKCVVLDLEHYVRLISVTDFAFATVFDSRNLEGFCSSKALQHSAVGKPLVRMVPQIAIALLRLQARQRVILTREFSSPSQWTEVERTIQAILLQLPESRLGHVSFCTLSLSAADPVRLLAIPS